MNFRRPVPDDGFHDHSLSLECCAAVTKSRLLTLLWHPTQILDPRLLDCDQSIIDRALKDGKNSGCVVTVVSPTRAFTWCRGHLHIIEGYALGSRSESLKWVYK